MSERLDVDEYLKRIGETYPEHPTVEVLRRLHVAHVTTIPFENLDIQLGHAIHLDLPSLEEKLIRRRRGGYCFEHNTLFAAALEALGYVVTPIAARVRMGIDGVSPRNHMCLLVRAEDCVLLCDVGFGAEGLLLPILLKDHGPSHQFEWTYQLKRDDCSWVLQSLQSNGTWLDLYSCTEERQEAVDFEVANHYTSTHPSSRFVRGLTVQLPTPRARHILKNGVYEAYDGNGCVSTQTLHNNRDLLLLLSSVFGLDLPHDTRFGCFGESGCLT